MSLKIDVRKIDDVYVLDIKGKILLGEGDVKLKETVDKIVNDGGRKIVFNLENVPYMDSSGLGEMVRCYTTVKKNGGDLKLANLMEKLEDLLSITKLITVFDVYDSVEEAVNSFS